MGVPFCFGCLRKKKKVKILKNLGNKKINILYFDWNCLLHPQCFKVLAKNIEETDQDELSRKMFKQIIEYTNYVIRFIAPTQYIYFAIDGVAPLAKIRQQRQRRFGYAHDYKKEIMDKYGIKYNDSWSNVVITPGTEFMDKLHNKIIEYYSDPINKKEYTELDVKILYSSYHSPGEGEHKIMQDIKSRFGTDNRENICIYGLDADLLFLSMACQRQNIYLVREDSMFSNNSENELLVYVDMDDTKEKINEMFIEDIQKYNYQYFSKFESSSIDKKSFIDDYILICYLLGNDFLPHFPSIDLKRDGMDILIQKYSETFCENNYTTIINRENTEININTKIFVDFISRLGACEYTFFVDKLHNYISKEKKYLKCMETEQYKIKIWEIENLINCKIEDNIKLGIGNEDNWKFNYYKHMGSQEHQEDFIDKVCENYMEGIIWVAQYYMNKCDNWIWQYEFTHSPLISDLSNYLLKKPNLDLNKFIFNKVGPVNIFTQLVSVLPPKFNYLLPQTYRYLSISPNSPIIDMYPIKYEIDKLYKSKLYQCIPIIPTINLERIINATIDLKLSKKEKKLSEIHDLIYL